VETDKGCWEYRGAKSGAGYRKVGRDGITWLAHRYAWSKLVGEIPEGKLVLHDCDNRACCRPSHLFIGTHLDNMADMVSKGRDDFSGLRTGPWFERLPRKYSKEQIAEMERLRFDERLSLVDIGERLGVRWAYVSYACAKSPRYKKLRINGELVSGR
jgi:hypothetical protein